MRKSFVIVSIIFTSFIFSADFTSAQDVVYKIGDRGPAGGWVFYDKGNDTDGWRYLEVAPVDQATGANWGAKMIVGATDKDIGTGKLNTQKMLLAYGVGKPQRYAAELCSEYRGGDKSDWFLPSLYELNLIYKNLYKKNIGGFSYYRYWSSSEHDEHFACYQDFNDGKLMANYKYQYPSRVRAIRAFK